MKRREFIKAGVFAAIGAAGCTGSRGFGAPCVGEAYAGWRTGELDIHFINTGVGEQTFFIFPGHIHQHLYTYQMTDHFLLLLLNLD